MDSITQMALGAAVGEAVLGRRLGYRAALYGAAIGTLPDLDVLFPLGDPVADFTYHRSASHSLLVLTLAAPGIAWLIHRIPRRDNPPWRSWWLMVFLALVTHPLLDAFTVYGTQLLWPLPVTPTSWSSLFIIDPVYTLPLLVGVLGTSWMARSAAAADAHNKVSGNAQQIATRGWRLNAAGLVLSTAYIAWSLVAKQMVEGEVRHALAEQGLPADRIMSTPAPFNTLLWRVVVMDERVYREGFVSLADRSNVVRFEAYPTDPDLLIGLADDWRVRRLAWFTQGFYGVQQRAADVLINDLRMGTEPSYVFSFRVGTRLDSRTLAAPTEQRAARFDMQRLGDLFKRIIDPDVDVRPRPR